MDINKIQERLKALDDSSELFSFSQSILSIISNRSIDDFRWSDNPLSATYIAQTYEQRYQSINSAGVENMGILESSKSIQNEDEVMMCGIDVERFKILIFLNKDNNVVGCFYWDRSKEAMV